MAEEEKPMKASSSRSEESVKLFVGQVPKHMTEPQLLSMFKEFALVDQVNIIKDKTTRTSRGSFQISLFLYVGFWFFFFLLLEMMFGTLIC